MALFDKRWAGIRSLVRSFARSFVVCSFVRSLIPSFVRLLSRSLVRLFVGLLARSLVRSFALSLARSSVRSLARSLVPSFVRLFARSFVRSFACSLVRSFVNYCPGSSLTYAPINFVTSTLYVGHMNSFLELGAPKFEKFKCPGDCPGGGVGGDVEVTNWYRFSRCLDMHCKDLYSSTINIARQA